MAGMSAVEQATPPWSRPVFTAEGALYTWADVADLARRDGTWERLRGDVRDGLAAARRGQAPDPAAVKQAAADFRYRRRLISGEETEAWLRARGVTVAEWTGYIGRAVLRAGSTGRAGSAAPPPADAEVDAHLWAEGRCSGLLDEAARSLAARVAAHARLAGARPERDEDVDTALDRLRAAVVTDDAVRALVASRHLDWPAVDAEEARFATEHAAREAVLSVRDDGVAFADVCAWAGVPLDRRRRLLEDADPAVRPLLLGAREGDVVGPVAVEGGFLVARVAAKDAASADDPAVRQRAADAVLAAAAQREVQQRVQWHDLG